MGRGKERLKRQRGKIRNRLDFRRLPGPVFDPPRKGGSFEG